MVRQSNPSKPAAPRPSERKKLNPKELAAQWGVAKDTIFALIRNGELSAINVAVTGDRPRFLIDLADVAIFEERRRVHPPEEVARPRRSRRAQPDNVTTFF